jgi:hypothetical protein
VDTPLGLEFTGQVPVVPEGRIVLAGEPLLEVTAPLPQAQLVETYVLSQVTSPTASDTASRKRPCPGRPVTAGIPGEPSGPDRTGPYQGEEKMMLHTVEWKVRLYLSEDDEGTTKARVVVNTGTTTLTGHGAARCNPADAEVPEIGDELAAGRAMHDLGQQLVSTAERDIKDLGAPGTGRSPRPAAGWPV